MGISESKRREKLVQCLITARKEMRLSQREVAAILKVSQSLISQAERGADISFLLMERWAALLQMPLLHFETLSSSTRARPRLDKKTPYYEGISLDEWREYAKTGTWVLPGFSTFCHIAYEATERTFRPGFARPTYRAIIADLKLLPERQQMSNVDLASQAVRIFLARGISETEAEYEIRLNHAYGPLKGHTQKKRH